MSDDLEYLARREREREQAEKEELQARKEERWKEEGYASGSSSDYIEYHAWKERTGFKGPPSHIGVLVFVWAVVIGLIVFFVVFGPG